MDMLKYRFTVVSLILILIFSGSWVVASQDSEEGFCVPTGVIELFAPDSVESKRSPVEFPHAAHFDYNCKTCHHKWKNDSNLSGCMATGCHDGAKSPKKAGKTDPEAVIKYYKNAYHVMCIGCHKQIQIDNKKLAVSGKILSSKLQNAGPTGCVGCHPRE
jgi:hypothetical protein